jgi:ribosomal protein S21
MAVWSVRRDDESNEKLIKRWKRQVNNARVVNALKKDRYRLKPETKRLRRNAAIKRSEFQEKRYREQLYS